MARVLAYASPATGHVHPLMPTLLELAERGHDVVARVPSWELERVRNAGITAVPIDPAIETIEHEDWKGKNPLDSNRISLEVFAKRAELELPDVRSAIDAAAPDLLLVDISTQGAAAMAEARGEPWAMYSPYPLYLPSRDAPTFGPGFKPPRGPLGRLRDATVRRITERACRDATARSNSLRSRLGLEGLAAPWDYLRRPPLLLSYTAEPFEYPRSDWPASVRLVGPGIWEPPAEQPGWLGAIDGPLVLVTASTEFQNDALLLQTALDALADGDAFVVATSGAIDPAELRVPANARVERHVPHGKLLPRAACVVCHGGMGITQKALAAGVPVCAVPFGRDQFEVARRVEVAGAGTRLPAKKLDERRLRDAVKRALASGGEARRIAEAFARAGGPAAAADALEDQLETRQGHAKKGAPR
jgi:MGT family glycosyltransferase